MQGKAEEITNGIRQIQNWHVKNLPKYKKRLSNNCF